MIENIILIVVMCLSLTITIITTLENRRMKECLNEMNFGPYLSIDTDTMRKIMSLEDRLKILENKDDTMKVSENLDEQDKRLKLLEILHNEELSRCYLDDGMKQKQCAVREKTPYYLYNNETREMRNVAEVWLEDDE